MTTIEQTKTTQPHILVITGSAEDCDRHYEIECPGVTDACREWRPCAVAGCAVVAEGIDAYPDQIAHGERHRFIELRWMTPTDNCFVSTADSMPDSADDLAGRERLVNGRHPIDFDYDGEGWYTLDLARTEAQAMAAGLNAAAADLPA